MLNPIEAYNSAGRLAGKAMNDNDGAAARFHADWARRAIALETDHDRLIATKAYESAYKIERNKLYR
jgi:hypothetical protein